MMQWDDWRVDDEDVMSRQFWRIGWISTLLMLISVSTGGFQIFWGEFFFFFGRESSFIYKYGLFVLFAMT